MGGLIEGVLCWRKELGTGERVLLWSCATERVGTVGYLEIALCEKGISIRRSSDN